MIELFVLVVLSLSGIVGTAALAFALVRSGWLRDRRLAERPASGHPEPPSRDYPSMERHPPEEIFPIMREFFPATYERYRQDELDDEERRWAWDSCCAIFDARVEIEEICG